LVAVRVSKRLAQDVITKLRKLGLVDYSRQIVKNGDYVLIPLLHVNDGPSDVLKDFEVVDAELPVREARPRNVMELLKDEIPTEYLDKLPSSYDILGHVAVINESRLPAEYLRVFAEALLKFHKNIRTVILKRSEITGEERVGEYIVIAGEEETETLHKESGCVFKLDIRKVFFSPRLSGERLRVAEQVKEGEIIVDMFAGVGPFSIIIARQKPSVVIHSIEKNKYAYDYLVWNIKANKVSDRVIPYLGDARDVLSSFKAEADRVIMNLPSRSYEFLDVAVKIAKEDTVIHYYTFTGKDRDDTPSHLHQILSKLNVRFEILSSRIIKEISPSKDMKVYDIRIFKSS